MASKIAGEIDSTGIDIIFVMATKVAGENRIALELLLHLLWLVK